MHVKETPSTELIPFYKKDLWLHVVESDRSWEQRYN